MPGSKTKHFGLKRTIPVTAGNQFNLTVIGANGLVNLTIFSISYLIFFAPQKYEFSTLLEAQLQEIP